MIEWFKTPDPSNLQTLLMARLQLLSSNLKSDTAFGGLSRFASDGGLQFTH